VFESVSNPRQGDIWWAEVQSAKRPTVIVARSEAVPVLTSIVVAPVTPTIRSIPAEIHVGANEGLDVECVVSLDNLLRISRVALPTNVGDHGIRRRETCATVKSMTDC